MKKILLFLGILFLVLSVLALAAGVCILFIYKHTLDGSQALYHKQQKIMYLCFLAGAIAGILGILCLILRSRT